MGATYAGPKGSEYMAGKAIRMPREKLRDDGFLPGEEYMVDGAINSALLTLDAFEESDTMLVNPRLRFRTEPKRLIWDLIADRAPTEQALAWIGANFNRLQFTENAKTGMRQAIRHWVRSEHSIEVWADTNEVKIK